MPTVDIPCALVDPNWYATGTIRTYGGVSTDAPDALSTADGYGSYWEQFESVTPSEMASGWADVENHGDPVLFVTFPPYTPTGPVSKVELVCNADWGGSDPTMWLAYDVAGVRVVDEVPLATQSHGEGFKEGGGELSSVTAAMLEAGLTLSGGPPVFSFYVTGSIWGFSCSYLALRVTYAGTTHAPPLRQYPRSDGLGASSSRRAWPPPRSRQRSLRQGPGSYL